ncbi:hypothetical protein [Eisenbergiella sp.]
MEEMVLMGRSPYKKAFDRGAASDYELAQMLAEEKYAVCHAVFLEKEGLPDRSDTRHMPEGTVVFTVLL